MVVSSHLISPSYNHCNNYREINSIAPHPNQKFQKCLGYSLIAIFTFRIYSVPSSQVDLLAKREGGYEGKLSGKLWKNAVAKTCIP